jgi:hypothetical protein
MALGREAAALITSKFPRPVQLEFEKVGVLGMLVCSAGAASQHTAGVLASHTCHMKEWAEIHSSHPTIWRRRCTIPTC